jgi:hypothetical protein
MDREEAIKETRAILERYLLGSGLTLVDEQEGSAGHHMLLSIHPNRMFSQRLDNILQEWRNAGIVFTEVEKCDPSDPGRQWKLLTIETESLKIGLQQLLPNLNNPARREKFIGHLKQGGVIQNPWTGEWLNPDIAAQVLAERKLRQQQALRETEDLIRGGTNAQSLERRVSALLNDSPQRS